LILYKVSHWAGCRRAGDLVLFICAISKQHTARRHTSRYGHWAGAAAGM